MDLRTVEAQDVGVDGVHEPFVEHVSFTAPAGRVTFVATDPGVPQVALALAIGGRVQLRSGRISVGGATSIPERQLRTRLVDVADVTAPEDAIAVRAVVQEELALAERPASRSAVTAFLDDRGLSDAAGQPWERLPAGTRTSLLLELGALHPEVRVLVLSGPERHGGEHRAWLDTCERLAATGLVVIVLTTAAVAASLDASTPVPVPEPAPAPAPETELPSAPEPTAEPEPAPEPGPTAEPEPAITPEPERTQQPEPDATHQPESAPEPEPRPESAPASSKETSE